MLKNLHSNMRNLIFFAAILVSVFALRSSEDKIGNYEIIRTLNELEDEFGMKFYQSLFSVEEIRPYSILQSQKTIDLYSDEWLSSSEYIEVLAQDDLDNLKEKIIAYLNSLSSSSTIQILKKVENWCIIDMQFTVFNKYGLNQDMIIGALFQSEFTNEVFDDYINSGPFSINTITENQKHEIINDAKNLIASQPTKDQLYFHSSLYKNFALEY